MHVTIPTADPDAATTRGTTDPDGSAQHVIALHIVAGHGWPTGPRYTPGQTADLPAGTVLIASNRHTASNGTTTDRHTLYILDRDRWTCPAPSASIHLRPDRAWPTTFLTHITTALADADRDAENPPAPFRILQATGAYRRAQGWAQEATALHYSGARVRCRIYRDCYDRQSYATTEMWTSTGWTQVVRRDPATWPPGTPQAASREEDAIRRYAAALQEDLLTVTDAILHP